MTKAATDGELLDTSCATVMPSIGTSRECARCKNAILSVEASAETAGRHTFAQSPAEAAGTKHATTETGGAGCARCATRCVVITVGKSETWSLLGC